MAKPKKAGDPKAKVDGARASIFVIKPGGADDAVLEPLTDEAPLPAGVTNLLPFEVGTRTVLLTYDKARDHADAFVLSESKPYLAPAPSPIALPGGPWDLMDTFLFGNERNLLTYRADTGTFGVFRINARLEVSPPYTFGMPRNWPTRGFTTVAAFQSLGGQYVLGYNFEDGSVGIYALVTTPRSSAGAPPLVVHHVWYHTWAPGWTHFAFFALGGAAYFFKINTKRLNVNIDHVQDDPTAGTVEVGSRLQDQLPDALRVTGAVTVPWTSSEPRLATYVKETGEAVVYRIHADCEGWTALGSAKVPDASLLCAYRVAGASYLLFYRG